MKSVGIICEYNPFHNGHLYHLEKVKEMFKGYTIILVLSPSFSQHGEVSVINKWDKTKLALQYGVDLVVELPFAFATQSADFFARGSIELLNELYCEYIVFGSESNDIHTLSELATIQLSSEYDTNVKEYMNLGNNYPTALSLALNKIGGKKINQPNDILGVSYIREIIKLNSSIKPISIKRTNEYNGTDIDSNIISATMIRKLVKDKQDISKYIPDYDSKLINTTDLDKRLFYLLKYQIINNIDNLNIFQTVDEGIENRIKKYIFKVNSLDELIIKIKSKRYTYSKIRRMFIHILCNFTKEYAKEFQHIEYIRVLGINKNGQNYLKMVKKIINIPIITNCKNINIKQLDFEHKITNIYDEIVDNNLIDSLEHPIILK